MTLLAGVVGLYRNDKSLSNVPMGGLAIFALGTLILGFITWTPFVAGHHTYELTVCEDSILGSTTDREPFGNLSATSQEIVCKAHETGGEYRSLQKPSDFEYVFDYLRATPIEYQGQCYAMLTRTGGMGFAGLFVIPPALRIGVLSTWAGVSKLRSGNLIPPAFGPAIVGVVVFSLLFVFTAISTTVRGVLVGTLIAPGAGALWHRITPIARIRKRGR